MSAKVTEATEDAAKAAPAQSDEKQPRRPEQEGGPLQAARTAAASTLPPSSGAAGRARIINSMQRVVGNARLSRMLNSAAGREAVTPDRSVLQGGGGIQMMSVSHPDSPSEREAETVAQRVSAGQKARPIAPVSPNEVLPAVQPQEGKKEEKKEETGPTPTAQREASGPATEAIDTSSAADAVARKGAGSPVNPDLRRTLEPRMGADLGAARVHNDSAANEAARSINARAFTHGQDIFLARGESESDPHLMAHELTHTVQQAGASSPISRAPAKESKGAKAGAEELVAPAELELKGRTEFPAEEPVGKFLEEHTGKEVTVNTRFGQMARGPLHVKRDKKGKYHARQQSLPLTHPLFAAAGEALQGLQPSLIVSIEGSAIQGYVGLAAMSKLPKQSLSRYLKEGPELFGLVGFDFPKPFELTNTIEGGALRLGLAGVTLSLGSAFVVTLEKFMVEDEKVTFAASADINVKGMAKGTLKLERTDAGLVTGKVTITVEKLKNFSGGIEVVWDGRAINGTGEVGYQSEKLSGKVTLHMMEKEEAEALSREKKAPPEAALQGAKGREGETKDKPRKKKGSIQYVIFGEGDLTFAFTEWLNGTAHVIVDPEGYVTIVGKITPQKQFELFELKEFVKPLFKFEARASYGLPVVGNIFIFGNVGLDAVAKLGPAVLKDITVEGTYSTNPEENKDFRISGVINVSAFAGLRLRAEAGVGIEILSHDIKAGAGINGIVGIQGYAEAKPIIGYREKGEPGADKKGEFFIRGELEIAAQPFLGLSGDLFIELDTPWWSPLSDDKWTWPLGSKEWPIGGSFGLKASVDYVFGSKQWPSFEFQPVDFSAEKFMTDMYNDRAKPKSADAGDQQSDWKEKNQEAAEPPKEAAKTDAAPGKAGELPPAKATVQPGGSKKTKKDADPKAATAEGKTVEELQQKAAKEGKKEPVKDPRTGEVKEKAPEEEKPKPEEDHAKKWERGVKVVDQALAYAEKTGIDLTELNQILKSIGKRKEYGFTSLYAEVEEDDFVVMGSMSAAKPVKKIRKKPNRFKAVRRPDGTIEGDWDDFDWNGYPDHEVTPHPANAEFGHKNGTTVPHPRGGKYVVGYKFSETTPGAKYTDQWRQIINDERDAIKTTLRAKNPSWSDSDIDKEAKKEVEKKYGMFWTDLYLLGWQAHHIRQVKYWNGSNADSNLQYLKERPNSQNPKTGEHSPFDPWWSRREKELEAAVP